jgi:Tfp pilus assembly protein PilN
MRELEFLPAWYPQMRRRKRFVFLHAYATILVMAGLGLWLFLASRNTSRREGDRDAVARQLAQSRDNLTSLTGLLGERQKLEAQQRVISKLGVQVEASRLLAKLDEIMPKEMTLTEATFDTVEQTRSAEGSSDPKAQETSRKLLVKVSGVTPSDADWAGVLAKLSSVPFFQDVRLVGAHDKPDKGHLMREFEVSFVVDLGTGS